MKISTLMNKLKKVEFCLFAFIFVWLNKYYYTYLLALKNKKEEKINKYTVQ
jgi:hypothetical protein